jgi:hypothetical protein
MFQKIVIFICIINFAAFLPRDSSVSVVNRLGDERQRSIYGIAVESKSSFFPLGLIQLSVVLRGTVSSEVKRPGHKDDQSSLCSIEIMKAWSVYFHSHIRLHIVELK